LPLPFLAAADGAEPVFDKEVAVAAFETTYKAARVMLQWVRASGCDWH
jgi:hypothetical protein